ncbi:MAG TPA: hypothetical protein HPP97_00975 [Desulfuromonadales bacterium]|nr:hypothetical protein [Desulfuromonadales bacterium]
MQQTVSETTSVENQINLFFHNHLLGKRPGRANVLATCLVSIGYDVKLERVVGFSKEQIECFVQQFIELLPPVFRERLLLLATTNGKK